MKTTMNKNDPTVVWKHLDDRDVETIDTYYRHHHCTRTLLLLQHYVTGHMIVSQRLCYTGRSSNRPIRLFCVGSPLEALRNYLDRLPVVSYSFNGTCVPKSVNSTRVSNRSSRLHREERLRVDVLLIPNCNKRRLIYVTNAWLGNGEPIRWKIRTRSASKH